MKKGCVYFIRHKGLSPVKIGFSNSEKPTVRFNKFCTFAPYGGELLCYISCENAYKLERELHMHFKKDRLGGEWFNISYSDIINHIGSHDGFNDCDTTKSNGFNVELLTESKKRFNEIYAANENIKKAALARELGVSRKTIYQYLYEYNDRKVTQGYKSV